MSETIEISNLLPAPGWKAYTCVVDYLTDRVDFWELPVVGWGVAHTKYPNGDEEDQIKLFVFEDNGTRAIDDSCGNEYAGTIAIPPGREFHNERKTKLEQQVRRNIARQQKL